MNLSKHSLSGKTSLMETHIQKRYPDGEHGYYYQQIYIQCSLILSRPINQVTIHAPSPVTRLEYRLVMIISPVLHK